MSQQANAHRRDLQLELGSLVLLRLQTYRKTTLATRLSHTLAKRYYGPFKVLERVGAVAYRLDVPLGCKIHPVFHISVGFPFFMGLINLLNMILLFWHAPWFGVHDSWYWFGIFKGKKRFWCHFFWDDIILVGSARRHSGSLWIKKNSIFFFSILVPQNQLVCSSSE